MLKKHPTGRDLGYNSDGRACGGCHFFRFKKGGKTGWCVTIDGYNECNPKWLFCDQGIMKGSFKPKGPKMPLPMSTSPVIEDMFKKGLSK